MRPNWRPHQEQEQEQEQEQAFELNYPIHYIFISFQFRINSTQQCVQTVI